LNQNGNYLWVEGMQAAPRDPLAHIMPLTFWGGAGDVGGAAWERVVEVVNETVMQVRTQPGTTQYQDVNSIPWGRQAYGEDASAGMFPSDLEHNLAFTIAMHALATHDVSWLDRPVPWNGTVRTVAQAMIACFAHLRDTIGLGEHAGLVRLRLSDHNDGLLGNLGLKGANFTNATLAGESGMNTALGAYVLPQLAEVLEAHGDAAAAAAVAAFAQLEAGNLAQQYVHTPDEAAAWVRRVYLGTPQLGWRGDPQGDGIMWTETQSWTLLSNALGDGDAAALIAYINATVRAASPIGVINAGMTVMNDQGEPPPPLATLRHLLPLVFASLSSDCAGGGYGGVWQCGELALQVALGQHAALIGVPGTSGSGSDMALDEWRKNALATHATVYPGVWYGATSGPDVLNSVLSASPGATRCDWLGPGDTPPCHESAFPILNMWSHTTPSFAIPFLAGFEPHWTGFKLRLLWSPPQRPITVYTPLVSAVAGPLASCNYTGHYAPAASAAGAVLTVAIAVPASAGCRTVLVSGAPVPAAFQSGPPGVVTVTFNATVGSAACWLALAHSGPCTQPAGDAAVGFVWSMQ